MHAWILGLRLAKDMLYTGRRIGAVEALQCGLASRVVPRAELESATLSLVEQIAKAPPFSLKLTKRSLNRAQDIQSFRVAAEATFDTHQLSHTVVTGYTGGADAVQAMKAKIGWRRSSGFIRSTAAAIATRQTQGRQASRRRVAARR